MPLPFDMLVVMLYLGWYAETPPDAPAAGAGAGALLCLAAMAAAAGIAAVCNLLALRALRKQGRGQAGRRRIAANAELAVRVAQAGLFAAVLHLSDFPWAVAAAFGAETGAGAGGSPVFLVQLLGILPYAGVFFAGWLPLYPLHRTVSSGVWTRGSFILNKARYNLYMLAAWAPFALFADLFIEHAAALPVLFAAAAWLFPAALAKLWGCTPLPEGETMELVREMEKAAGTGFSRVFLWEPGGGAMNAAAVGLARPFRYLFLTPGLLRGLTRDELAAVILHELGHVRHRHLIFYLFTTMGGVNAAVLAGALLPLESSTGRFLATAALILLYFRFVFGWLSRNMERQADLFALDEFAMEAGADERPSRPLANALEKLGIAAGGVRLAASWHHLGIAERVDFLRRAERELLLINRHNDHVRVLKAGGYLASLAAMAFFLSLAVPEFTPWFLRQPRRQGSADAGGEALERAHWRRVSALLPAAAAESWRRGLFEKE